MNVAWFNNDIAQALRDGWEAYAILAAIPSYEIRARMVTESGKLYQKFSVDHFGFVALLSGQPNGRAALDSLVRLLNRAIVLSPAEATRDTMLRLLERQTHQQLQEMIAVVSLYGTKAAPIVATHWYNQAVPTQAAPPELAQTTGTAARMRTLDDGMIHIIEYGFFGCPEGPPAAKEMQRMLRDFPHGVDAQYYTTTTGSWGNALVEPDVEAEHLRKYWVEYQKITFPITIWAGKKVSTPDGGMLPENSSTKDAYFFRGCPTFAVVDGKGIVRYWGGGFAPIVKERLHKVVTLLVREQANHASQTSAP